MRKLLLLAALISASVLLFAAVFSVVHRPLTIGEVPRLLASKSAYARSLPSPKLVVFAGSGGRYSHRCGVLTEITGWPCANLSIAVGIGLDFLIARLEPLLQPGDAVYVPLEYGQYRSTSEQMAAGTQNYVLVHDLPQQLWALPALRIVRAYGSFDLPFLIHGLLEMGLQCIGVQRRAGTATMTPQGDDSGHTEAAGLAYRDFLLSLQLEIVKVPAQSHALDVLDAFLLRMRERGVLVIGGLPTTPVGTLLDMPGIDGLRARYERAGHRFVVLDNRSQYPLSCFFDTLSHLNEPCQLRHSALLGQSLRTHLTHAAAP